MSVLDVMDELQNDRINGIEERLRSVEQAVVELATMAKWMKYGVIAFAASLGIDIQGMI
jgi:hypothetical protein